MGEDGGQDHKAVLWATVISAIAAVIGIPLAILGLMGRGSDNGPPASTPIPTASSVPSPAAPTPPPTAPPSSSPEPVPSPPPSAGAVTYLDNYINDCHPSPSSIQRTGPATIKGRSYAHTVSQTANGFPTYLALSGNAKRLQATVGLVTAAALPDQQVQFELIGTREGGGETQLYISEVLTHGQTDKVEVSLAGLVRIGLRAIPVGTGGGHRGQQAGAMPRSLETAR